MIFKVNQEKVQDVLWAHKDGQQSALAGHERHKHPLAWETGHKPKWAQDMVKAWHQGYDAIKERKK